MSTTKSADVNVNVNGEQAEDQLTVLAKKAKKFREQMEKANKAGNVKQYQIAEQGLKKMTKEARQLEKQMFDVDKVLRNLGGASLRDLTKAQRQLNRELNNPAIKRNSKEWSSLTGKMRRVRTEISKVKVEMRGTQPLMTRLSNGFNKYFTMVGTFLASVAGVAFGLKEILTRNGELADSLANVRKTTDLTKKEVRALYRDFRQFNTRTPRKELLMLAEEAGRLGIRGSRNILDFVKSANKINVALGDDLGDNAGKAILEVGKITSNLKVAEKYGVDFARAMDMAGSSINELAQSTKAQAPYIIDWSKRLSGVAKNAGIAAQDIFGLATTFDEMGQTLEMSATAVNKVMVDMFTDTEKYAEITGMSLKDFSKLLNTDTNEAFIRLLESLKNNNDGFQVMANRLDDLGIDGARAVQAISAIASDTDKLRKNQELANTALKEGVSLTNEYNIKNDNLAGSLDKIGRWFRKLFINSSLNKALEETFGWFAKLTDVKLSETLKNEQTEVNLLVVELTNSNIEAERRNTIYEKLKQINPDIVKGINMENIAVETLRKNLKKYNDEIINKIALQESEEALQDEREKLGSIKSDKYAKELELSKDLIKIKETAYKWDEVRGFLIDDILLSDIDIIEKEMMIRDLANEIAMEQKLGAGWLNLSNLHADQLVKLRTEEYEAQQEFNKAFEEYQNMYQSIMQTGGGVLPEPLKQDDDNTKSIVVTLESLNKELKLLEQQYDKIDLSDKESLAANLAKRKSIQKVIDEYKILGKEKKKAFDPTNLKEAYSYEDEYLQMKAEMLAGYREEEFTKLHENYDRETILLSTKHQEELNALGNNKVAKEELENKFRQDELNRNIEYLNALKSQFQNLITQDEKEGLSIEDAILSDAEKENLLLKIDELNLKIAQLTGKVQDLKGNDDGGDDDIFGMDPDEWSGLMGYMNAAISAAGQLNDTMAMYYARQDREEQEALRQFELNQNKKIASWNEQLANKEISQEEYNARVSTMDIALDKEKRKLEIAQWHRSHKLAMSSAIIKAAGAILAGLNTQPFMPLGLIMGGLAAVLGGVQVGIIAKETPPTFATGRYPITAADGNTYNASMYGKPKTTEIVKGPALISELEDEMIIDGPTTRNLVFRYPNIVDGIKDLSRGLTPQFGNGRYPSSTNTTEVRTETFTDPAMIALLEKLSVKLDEPWESFIDPNKEDNLKNLKTAQVEYDKFQKMVG